MQIRPSKLELERIRVMIRNMSTRSAIFRLLREELKAIGNWKEKPRGKPGFRRNANNSE